MSANPGTSVSVEKSAKRSYDSAFKLRVVEYAVKHSNRGAGRQFNVDEKRVREWRSQRDELACNPKRRRLEGGGRKTVLSDETEERIIGWIEALRAKHLRVTYKMIMIKGKELAVMA
jgi:Brinker DNA-binding domain